MPEVLRAVPDPVDAERCRDLDALIWALRFLRDSHNLNSIGTIRRRTDDAGEKHRRHLAAMVVRIRRQRGEP